MRNLGIEERKSRISASTIRRDFDFDPNLDKMEWNGGRNSI